MPHRLVIGEPEWSALNQHLLRDLNEHLGFIFAGWARINGFWSLYGREVILIDDSDLRCDLEEGLGLSLRLDTLLRVMNEAKGKDLALVEAHSHPPSQRQVRFSHMDVDGQREVHGHLRDVFGEVPYGALVLGSDSVDGLIWMDGNPNPISEVRVVGESLVRVATTSDYRPWRKGLSTNHDSSRVYERQIRALGRQGQRALQQISVGIVGLGGIGSVVAQELAHLGVRTFTLVDFDLVEATNLNRLVGANRLDVGRSKVDVAARMIRAVTRRSKVHRVASNVRSREALEALKGADVIFGCVDSDSGRLILNELALAYCVPYIDSGVGIEAEDGGITDAGGRVVTWTLGKPCLLCAGEVNLGVAAEELESEEQREFRRQHGYVAGTDIPAPSVISLNGTVASLAVTEFLGLVTGVKKPNYYTYYDLLEQRVGPRLVRRNEKCVACAVAGLGDRANIERYSREGPPAI